MPKDPTRNVDRYKVRGGQFDDLDRTKNDGMTEDAAPSTGGPEETNFIPGESPQEAAERKQRLMEEVHAKAEQRRQAEGAGAGKFARAGRGKAAAKSVKKSAKKSAAKSAKKSAKASAGGAKRGAKKASRAAKKAGKGGSAAGAKKGAKAAAGKKAGRGGGAKKSVKRQAGKKVTARTNRSRAGRPGAG